MVPVTDNRLDCGCFVHSTDAWQGDMGNATCDVGTGFTSGRVKLFLAVHQGDEHDDALSTSFLSKVESDLAKLF
jgi:hypothetical protein